MKKLIILFMVIGMALMPVYGFADSPPRDASGTTVGLKATNFTNIQVTGLESDGNPGYIAMVGAYPTTTNPHRTYRALWYLWVDDDGDLCMASDGYLQTQSDFPDGNFNNLTCTKVGSQS